MSHVDEGALHAYLDGALDEFPATEAREVREHLEECAECAERLEVERRVRQAATAMLALAEPSVEIPSFEELRAYVQATRPHPSRMSVRLYRLGWAASVVLALGAGWMVRGGRIQPVTAPEAEAIGPATEGAGDRASRASGVQDIVVSAGREQRVDAPEALLEAPARQLESQQVGQADFARGEGKLSEEVGAEELRLSEDRPTVLGEIAENAAVPDFADRDELAPVPAEAFAMVQAEPVPDSSGARANERQVAGAGAAVDDAVASADPAIDLRGPDSLPVTAPAAPSPATSDREQARRAVERERVQLASRREVDALAGPPASLIETPIDVDDEAGLIVPGLEVLGWSQIAEGTVSQGVHAMQRLENGELLDVYHLPQGVDPAILGPVETGRNEVRAEREGTWIVLRAVLPLSELQALLARMNPEG